MTLSVFDINIVKNIVIDIFQNVLINIFKIILIDIDINIDIFKNGHIDIDIDIDIFQKCRYIDNRYVISIYRTGLAAWEERGSLVKALEYLNIF